MSKYKIKVIRDSFLNSFTDYYYKCRFIFLYDINFANALNTSEYEYKIYLIMNDKKLELTEYKGFVRKDVSKFKFKKEQRKLMKKLKWDKSKYIYVLTASPVYLYEFNSLFDKTVREYVAANDIMEIEIIFR